MDLVIIVVNFATSKSLVVKGMMYPYWNMCQYSGPLLITRLTDWPCVDRWRYHSSILDVQSFRGVECDPDHYLMVANVREILLVRKQATLKFDVKIQSQASNW